MIAIDANILVYAFDERDPRKHKIAKQLFENVLAGKQSLVVTNQILAEFVRVSTQKLPVPLTKQEATIVTTTVLHNSNWIIYNYTARSVVAASSAPQPFWDALLAQTLVENGVRELYTENVKDFTGSGITAKNPFTKK